LTHERTGLCSTIRETNPRRGELESLKKSVALSRTKNGTKRKRFDEWRVEGRTSRPQTVVGGKVDAGCPPRQKPGVREKMRRGEQG